MGRNMRRGSKTKKEGSEKKGMSNSSVVPKYSLFAKASLAPYISEEGSPVYLKNHDSAADMLTSSNIMTGRSNKNSEFASRPGMALAFLSANVAGACAKDRDGMAAATALKEWATNTDEGKKMCQCAKRLNIGKDGSIKRDKAEGAITDLNEVMTSIGKNESLRTQIVDAAMLAGKMCLACMSVLEALAFFEHRRAWTKKLQGSDKLTSATRKWMKAPNDDTAFCKALVEEFMLKVAETKKAAKRQSKREQGKKKAKKQKKSKKAKSSTSASSSKDEGKDDEASSEAAGSESESEASSKTSGAKSKTSEQKEGTKRAGSPLRAPAPAAKKPKTDKHAEKKEKKNEKEKQDKSDVASCKAKAKPKDSTAAKEGDVEGEADEEQSRRHSIVCDWTLEEAQLFGVFMDRMTTEDPKPGLEDFQAHLYGIPDSILNEWKLAKTCTTVLNMSQYPRDEILGVLLRNFADMGRQVEALLEQQ